MHRRIDGFTFNVTVGLLAKKGRDATAEKVKQGDITEQKLRDVIVGESFKPKENMKLRGTEQKKNSIGVNESKILKDATMPYQSFGDMRIWRTQTQRSM